MKARILENLEGPDWSWNQINLLFIEFGLESLGDDGRYGPFIHDIVGSVDDDKMLIDLYSVVVGIEQREIETDLISASETGSWNSGYVKLFLSHHADSAELASRVASELAVVGIQAFVAHDFVEYSKPWQDQIETALKSAQVFVALVDNRFNSSTWCGQEVGWAIGRQIPRYFIRVGDTPPVGFPSREQWPSCVPPDPKLSANMIQEWVFSLPELGSFIFDGLLAALAAAGNYYSAEATAKRITALGHLSDDQFAQIGKVWWTNNQLHGGVLPSRVMRRFFESNDKEWPPPKDQAKTTGSTANRPSDAWDPSSDEPF